jgi:hypothetical protein
MFDEAKYALKNVPAIQPALTSHSQVVQAIKGLQVGNARGPIGTANSILRHLPKSAMPFVTKAYNSVLRRQYLPPAWTKASFLPILKPVKNATMPSFCRHVSPVYNAGKPVETFLTARVFREVNNRHLLRDKRYGFRPTKWMMLQLSLVAVKVSKPEAAKCCVFPGCG